MTITVSNGIGKINSDGEILVNSTDNLLSFTADYSLGQTDLEIIPNVANKHIEIHSIFVSSNTTTGSIILKEETSGTVLFKIYLSALTSSASTELHVDLSTNRGLLLTCPNNSFISITYHIK